MLSIVLGLIIAKHFKLFVFPSSAGKGGKTYLILVGPCEIPGVCNGSGNRNPLSFLFHLRRKQYQFWRRCGLKKPRSRQVFKTLVKLVILHYQNEEACWPSHYMLQLRYIRVPIHCKERNIINVLFYGNEYSPSPVAARSMAWVCGSSLAAIAGLSLAGGMDFCLYWVLCVVR
jgi:hypothetical protein